MESDKDNKPDYSLDGIKAASILKNTLRLDADGTNLHVNGVKNHRQLNKILDILEKIVGLSNHGYQSGSDLNDYKLLMDIPNDEPKDFIKKNFNAIKSSISKLYDDQKNGIITLRNNLTFDGKDLHLGNVKNDYELYSAVYVLESIGLEITGHQMDENGKGYKLLTPRLTPLTKENFNIVQSLISDSFKTTVSTNGIKNYSTAKSLVTSAISKEELSSKDASKSESGYEFSKQEEKFANAVLSIIAGKNKSISKESLEEFNNLMYELEKNNVVEKNVVSTENLGKLSQATGINIEILKKSLNHIE